jgi:serine/threonine protein phosphatase 1
MASTFVIGDIHGEITKLKQLIANLEKQGIDKLIFLGDYIDKGENSRKTLEYLDKLRKEYNCTFLIGNHEYIWLNFISIRKEKNPKDCEEFILKYGGETTIKDFNMLNLTKDEVLNKLYNPFKEFFDSLKSFIITNEFNITHSGVNMELDHKNDWNTFEKKEFLFQRHNFIDSHELINNRITIFGHTAFTYPYVDDFKIGIDTGAAYLKDTPLTAFNINKKVFINNLNEIVSLNDLQEKGQSEIIKLKKKKELEKECEKI